jgi:hypothetical protein
MPNARENDKNEWIQVKYKNSPKTNLTSPVKNFTMHNAYGILSQSDDPIPENKKYLLTAHHHNRTPTYANTIGNARSHSASISN